MKRHSKLGLIIAFLVSVTSSAVGDCKCGRAQKGETTHWGGNIRIEIEEKNHVKVLRGVVEHGETPIQGALVEVFTNTDYPLREPSDEPKRSQNKVESWPVKQEPTGSFAFGI